MLGGLEPDGAHVLRARVDMTSPNLHLRDPVLYRLRSPDKAPHFRTGGWAGGWVGGRVEGWAGGRVGGWAAGWVGGRVGGWVAGQAGGLGGKKLRVLDEWVVDA